MDRRENTSDNTVVRPVIINDLLQPTNTHNNNILGRTITQPDVIEHNGNVRNVIRSDILYDDRKFAVKKLYNAMFPTVSQLAVNSDYARIAKKQEEYLYVSTPSKLDYFKQLFIIERIFRSNDNQQSNQNIPCRTCNTVHPPTNLVQRIISQGNVYQNPFYERLNSSLRPDFSVLNRIQSLRPNVSNNEDMYKTPERPTRKRKNNQEDQENQNGDDKTTNSSSQVSKKRGRPPRK